MNSPGIHHITMIASDPQANLDFYAGTLGMRLVKVSVNQDDPGTYHFFYGDATGKPGSDLTFFPYPGGRRAQSGNGAIEQIRLLVPVGATEFWIDRLAAAGVDTRTETDRFGQKMIGFSDPDGLSLALVEGGEPGEPWADMPVPASTAITRSIGVSLPTGAALPEGSSRTGAFLERHLGFRLVGQEGPTQRWQGADGSYVDVTADRSRPFARGGHGGVHHIAFRAKNFDEQKEARVRLLKDDSSVSELIDRLWFRSIYFREPGGALFEIATDGPGFAADEPIESLGSTISLPPWLESSREAIERSLPKIERPGLRVFSQ